MGAKSGNPMKPMTMTKGQVRALLAGSTTLQQRMRPQPPKGTVRLECGRYRPTVARGGFMDAGPEVFGAWSPRDDWAQVCPYQPGTIFWIRSRSMPICAARIFREVVSASVRQDGVWGWVWTYELRDIPKPKEIDERGKGHESQK